MIETFTMAHAFGDAIFGEHMQRASGLPFRRSTAELTKSRMLLL